MPKAVLDELKSLRQERSELRGQVETLTGQVAEMDDLRGQLALSQRDMALARQGLTDPEAIAIAETLHNRLPAEDRPSLPDWFASVTESDSVPRALQAYVSAPTSVASSSSSLAAAAEARGPSTPQPAQGTLAEQAPPAPIDAKGRLSAATDRLNSLRRTGGTMEQMQAARLELQQALTNLRK